MNLPGALTTTAPVSDDGVAVWTPELGQTVELAAFSEAFRIDPALPVTAVAVLLTAAMLLVVATRRRRRE